MLKRGWEFAPGYRLQEFLGRGQFGQVWRANAPGGAAAAVKFIDLSDGQGQKEYDAVRRVKQIRHANLMPITAIWLLDSQGRVIEEAPDESMETIDLSAPHRPQQVESSERQQETHWLVVAMLLGGQSLQQRLSACVAQGLPGIPPKELISYMEESAKGIDFLNMPQHDLGDGPIAIQHSDVKPANIVLIGSSAVVCDFGLARILTHNQITATSTAGTPAYMAPEAISGKPSRSSDQYSLAVTYYHLRTGSLPVNDGSLWEVLEAHRRGNLKLDLVPEPEQIVLRKATSLNWEDRFETILDFVEALREALRAEGAPRPGFMPVEPATSPNGLFAARGGRRDAELSATMDLDANQYGGATAARRHDTAPASVGGMIKRHPALTVAVGLSLLALAAVPFIVPHGASNANQQEIGPLSGQEITVPDEPTQLTQTAGQLLSEAILHCDTNVESARASFRRALDMNPELAPMMNQIMTQGGDVIQMRATSDDRWLVSMADGSALTLHDLTAPSKAPVLLQGHERLINSMAIEPMGNRLLSGGYDSDARVWDLGSNHASEPLQLRGHIGSIEAVAWNGSGQTAITASNDGQLGIWELGPATSENRILSILRDRRMDTAELFKALACDPSDTWIAARTVGGDPIEPNPDVLAYRWEELWKTDSSPAPIRLGVTKAKHISFLSHAPEPTLAVGEIGGTVSLYSMAEADNLIKRTETDEFNTENHIDAMQVIATDDADIIVAGASNGSVLHWKYGATSESKIRSFGTQAVGCVDVSPDGRWVAAGISDGSVWLWDTDAESGVGAVRLYTLADSVDSILISPQTNWLIAGCNDGTIRLWDLRHAKLAAWVTPSDSEVIELPARDRPSAKVTMRYTGNSRLP